MENVPKIYVGVDISKDFLDVILYPTNTYLRVHNSKIGITDLIQSLSMCQVIRVACEASGGYERLMIKHLRATGYRVELIDPKLIRYFALSKKIKAKTDKIDARMIALYTACNEPEYMQPVMTEQHEELRDMVRRRCNVVEDIAREKKRSKQTASQISKNFINDHITYLGQQIKHIDQHINLLIKNNVAWKKIYAILLSIPGIGDITAASLLAEMPELGQIENKHAAALLGVTPRIKQSGAFEGKATIAGGRFLLRKIVYMGALSASHTKGAFQTYYQRLRNKGKAPKMCLVALMNKMIRIANTLVKNNQMWDPNYA